MTILNDRRFLLSRLGLLRVRRYCDPQPHHHSHQNQQGMSNSLHQNKKLHFEKDLPSVEYREDPEPE